MWVRVSVLLDYIYCTLANVRGHFLLTFDLLLGCCEALYVSCMYFGAWDITPTYGPMASARCVSQVLRVINVLSIYSSIHILLTAS